MFDPHLPSECLGDPECRLLRQLRDCPELLSAIETAVGPELALQDRLRKSFPDELVRHALLLVQLRRQARRKFSLADRMWFDRVGLEQATSEIVSRHKAGRFPPDVDIWDLCCGIGGDAIALAGRGRVHAVDLRPAAALRTLWNAQVYQVDRRINVNVGDVTATPLPEAFVHIDPDRRGQGSLRSRRLEDYVPGLDFLKHLVATCRGGAVKVGPASNFGGKFPAAEIELISLHGECKEATVWFGELAGEAPYRATVLPEGASLAGHPLGAETRITPLQSFVYDPDPAVVRAGLVDLCAEQLGLTRLDAAEEYLTGEEFVRSPFVAAFRVVAEFPNNERRLRRHLQSAPYGDYEVKCRHIPVEAEALRRRLPTGGDATATVFLGRVGGQARLILAERI